VARELEKSANSRCRHQGRLLYRRGRNLLVSNVDEAGQEITMKFLEAATWISRT
jgi:hypothetical protein